jgi:hypothetical protein
MDGTPVSPCHSLFTHVDTRADSKHRWEHTGADLETFHDSHFCRIQDFRFNNQNSDSIGLAAYLIVFQTDACQFLPHWTSVEDVGTT